MAGDGQEYAPGLHASASYAGPGIGQQRWDRRNRVAGTWVAVVGHMVRARSPTRASYTGGVVRDAAVVVAAAEHWEVGVRGCHW